MITFKDLGLQESILTAIAALGYDTPMPIQEQVIPFILNDTPDVVGLAQTGTGKTAAFGLPVLQLIDPAVKRTQSLILAPTRELCIQIANDLTAYAHDLPKVKVVPVYGGENIINQFKKLDVPPQIIVATPGRLIDLIHRNKVWLDDVRLLVLDEADEMLTMGFQDELETILQSVPTERRTMLFSATMSKEILKIAHKYMNDYKEIAVGTRNAGADNVEHIYYIVQASQRYLALKRIVDINPDIYGIIFCRTRQETKEVADNLMRDGYNADALHGDLSQAQRDAVMNKFRIHNLQLLVATDVAARGLDVNNLTHIINYNLPTDAEIYTHRSGRTGRANQQGISIALITPREQSRIKEIENTIGKTFTKAEIPSGREVCKRQLFHLIDKMENVEINADEIDQFLPHVFKKLDYLSKEDLIRHFAALEFNRFLEYYKDAEDLNVSAKEAKREADDSKGKKKSRKKKFEVRMGLNIGSKQNATPRSILRLINDVVDDKSVNIGAIDILPTCSFFDLYNDQVETVLQAFKRDAPPELELTVVTESPYEDFDGYRRKSKKRSTGRSSKKSSRKHSRTSRS